MSENGSDGKSSSSSSGPVATLESVPPVELFPAPSDAPKEPLIDVDAVEVEATQIDASPVAEAMLQLASNPLFAANPNCLGELLERLVHNSAEKAVGPVVETPVPSPVTPCQVASKEGGDEVQAYKSYWTKFKRPSTPQLGSEPAEKTPKKETVVVNDTQTPIKKKEQPDNQLGDSTVNPPSPLLGPSTPATTVEAASSEPSAPAAALAANGETKSEEAPTTVTQEKGGKTDGPADGPDWNRLPASSRNPLRRS
eukprot:s614_g15.t1